MLTPVFCRTMAAYNSEMNRRIYAAAGRLTRAERRQERGAFWGSIHGTLNHLLWGDSIWLSRFDGSPAPTVGLSGSAAFLPDFASMQAARVPLDQRIEAWATALAPDWLAGELTWFSGAAGRELTKPRALLVAHFFNHQTHHRGQVHAMLTAAGEQTGATDLAFILP
jgi:uncharacterized damage-inducible protein DinB